MDQSKLVLGTVQLGMLYGINNTTGQPDNEEAFSILDLAWQNGITTFDTASTYGRSESVLGEWIKSRALEGSVNVISKAKASRSILDEVLKSLERLHIKKLGGYLLHSAEYSDGVIENLQAIKNMGLTEHVGVSVYEPKEATDAVAFNFDYVQVPYNVFDRRLDAVGFFESAKAAGVTVFARSPFLQGLLLMEPSAVPDHLSHARPYLDRFRAIATAHDLSPLEAALQYVLTHSGIDHIVFGVETLVQLKEILVAKERDKSIDCIEELKDAFIDIDESIINPNLWSKK